MEKKRKGQAVSLDLIIGVVIFLLILIIVYSVLNADTPKDTKLRAEADAAVAKLEKGIAQDAGLPSITDDEGLNEEEIGKLYNLDYEETKQKLGLSGNTDICIIVVDDLGAIKTYDGKSSFGNPADGLNVSDSLECGN